MVDDQSFNFLSSALLTMFSIAVNTLSNLAIVAGHEVALTGAKVSLLSPLKDGGCKPLNLYNVCVFQKIRCVVSCAIEWFSLLSFQLACSGVKPAIAESTG